MAYTTIDNPELYFQNKTYTGNATGRDITLDGSENMTPDLTWIKSRSHTYSHVLRDSVRGANSLSSNNGNAEYSSPTEITSFDANGFSLGTDSGVNNGSHTFVAWNWKESATAGFDIISYTGNGTAGKTVAHNLSAVPDLIIIKNRSSATQFVTWQSYMLNTNALYINLTNALGTSQTYLNSTTPTSSVITLGGGNDENKNSDTHLIYAFKNVQGFSKAGTYVGNGNADGPYVHCGFRPSFLLGKNTGTAGNHWFMVDDARSPFNGDSKWIKADATDAELTNLVNPDFLANGFKIRNNNDIYNDSGEIFSYIAFADSPFVNSNGIPNNAR